VHDERMVVAPQFGPLHVVQPVSRSVDDFVWQAAVDNPIVVARTGIERVLPPQSGRGVEYR